MADQDDTSSGRRVSLRTENWGGRSMMVAGALASRAWLQPMSLQPSASHTSSYSCAVQHAL